MLQGVLQCLLSSAATNYLNKTNTIHVPAVKQGSPNRYVLKYTNVHDEYFGIVLGTSPINATFDAV